MAGSSDRESVTRAVQPDGNPDRMSERGGTKLLPSDPDEDRYRRMRMSGAEADRTNAQRSTGPRTAAGKGRSSQNSLQSGLRSANPLLPGGSTAQWERYRQGIV